MNSILSYLSYLFLTLLSLTSFITSSFAAPVLAKRGSNDVEGPVPELKVNATAPATFIPIAPYFVAYSDISTGVTPPDPSTLTVRLLHDTHHVGFLSVLH
jgi:hypothetical protein